jgi:hypothetical protein
LYRQIFNTHQRYFFKLLFSGAQADHLNSREIPCSLVMSRKGSLCPAGANRWLGLPGRAAGQALGQPTSDSVVDQHRTGGSMLSGKIAAPQAGATRGGETEHFRAGSFFSYKSREWKEKEKYLFTSVEIRLPPASSFPHNGIVFSPGGAGARLRTAPFFYSHPQLHGARPGHGGRSPAYEFMPNGASSMDCRYLHHFTSGCWKVTSCAARHQLYLPSLAELESYCRTGGHKDCPLFRTPFAREEPPMSLACWPYPFQEVR